jgi:hypothetical protein
MPGQLAVFADGEVVIDCDDTDDGHKCPKLGSTLVDEFFNCEMDIARDLFEKNWRNVSATVEWDSCGAPVRMTELFMRALLSHLGKS